MKSSNEDYDFLYEELIKSEKCTNSNIKTLLNKILDIQINEIKYIGKEEFSSITEYKFSLYKTKLIYNKDEIMEIYLKMIKGGKIKESIFCYWSLLNEEKYLNKNEKNMENTAKKVAITQTTTSENNSCIKLILNKRLNYYAEINLIELRNFAKNDEKIERWLNNLEIKYDDILFIGIKKY